MPSAIREARRWVEGFESNRASPSSGMPMEPDQQNLPGAHRQKFLRAVLRCAHAPKCSAAPLYSLGNRTLRVSAEPPGSCASAGLSNLWQSGLKGLRKGRGCPLCVRGAEEYESEQPQAGSRDPAGTVLAALVLQGFGGSRRGLARQPYGPAWIPRAVIRHLPGREATWPERLPTSRQLRPGKGFRHGPPQTTPAGLDPHL